MVDFSSEGGICTKPAHFPHYDLLNGAVGAFIGEFPVVCGGLGIKHCHGYKFNSQSWAKMPYELLHERSEAATIVLLNGTWLIIGGQNDKGFGISSSEMFKSDKFENGFFWPTTLWGHCMSVINSSHAYVVGGKMDEGFSLSFYTIQLESGYWYVGTELRSPRYHHTCGTIENFKSTLAVIAGGQNKLAVDLLHLETMQFSKGPNLPHMMNRAVSSQYNNMFLIIGGLHFGSCPNLLSECVASKFIYELDVSMSSWVKKSYTLETPRGGLIAIALPGDMDGNSCSKACQTCPGRNSEYRYLIRFFCIKMVPPK